MNRYLSDTKRRGIPNEVKKTVIARKNGGILCEIRKVG
jgi:hypothetical protein